MNACLDIDPSRGKTTQMHRFCFGRERETLQHYIGWARRWKVTQDEVDLSPLFLDFFIQRLHAPGHLDVP